MAVDAKIHNVLGRYYTRTAYVRNRLQKWFLFSLITGTSIGLAIAGVHIVIYEELWFRLRGVMAGYWWAFVLPLAGIAISALLVNRFAPNPGIHSTEEVIHAYNEERGRMRLAAFPAKVAASVVTLGLGGSAGMEGPSVYIGASVASWFRRVFDRLGFDEDDIPWMILAGGAAGISAIFKAPLTGIVFALEVPYKDDLAHDAFIPSLMTSVTSYLVFVSIVGIEPLFKVPHLYTVNYNDLLLSVVLGLVCGLAARVFVVFYHWFADFAQRRPGGFVKRALLGGVTMGTIGVVSIAAFGAPYALGTGYEAINDILAGEIFAWQLLALFFLKVLGTSATLAGGGVGGIFIPMIFMGATIGAMFAETLSVEKPLFPILGMAAFLSAGYNTPLAAATFIAETTGSPGFIIPGLVAAAVSYTISGRRSVSTHQRANKQTVVHKMLGRKVREVMTADVIAIPAEISIGRFVEEYLLKYRHKSFPVIGGDELFGMVGLCDIKRVPAEEWGNVPVGDVAIRDIYVAYPDQSLSEVSQTMYELDIDRLPVVDLSRPKKLVGLIASTDIVRLEELSDFVES